MKKLCNRFLALAMSLVLALGCSATCFAAEPDDVSTPDVPATEDYVVAEFDVREDSIPDNGIVELAIDKDGTVSLVEPRSTPIFTANRSDCTHDEVWKNTYGVPVTGTLHVGMSITGSCHIKITMKLSGSILTTNWVNQDVSSGNGEFYSPDTITAGSKFTITLSSFSNGTSWSLRGWMT